MWPAKDKEMIKPVDKEKMKYFIFSLYLYDFNLFHYQRINAIPNPWHRMNQSPMRSLMIDLFT